MWWACSEQIVYWTAPVAAAAATTYACSCEHCSNWTKVPTNTCFSSSSTFTSLSLSRGTLDVLSALRRPLGKTRTFHRSASQSATNKMSRCRGSRLYGYCFRQHTAEEIVVPVVQVQERIVQVGKMTPQVFDDLSSTVFLRSEFVRGRLNRLGKCPSFQVNSEFCIERLSNC